MSKVEASSIPAILDAIVGITSANGDTYLDGESMRNVDKLEAVCGWVCDRIYPAYSGDYPKQCASAEKVANAVRRASEFIPDYMGIDRAERTCRVECYPPGYEDNLHYEVCSECGTILTASRPGDRHAARASYCPSCGALVIGEGTGNAD